MIRLELDKAGIVYGADAAASPPKKFLQTSWRIVLALGFVFVQINDYAKQITSDRPWLWSLSIVASIGIAVAVDRLVLHFYIKYAPSIFDRDSQSGHNQHDV